MSLLADVWSHSIPADSSERSGMQGAQLVSEQEKDEAGESAEDQALRWRRTLLRLSDNFGAAAAAQPRLAPVLMELLCTALEQLLLFGRESDLMALDDWLSHENPGGEFFT